MFPNENSAGPFPEESLPGGTPDESSDFSASFSDEEFMRLFKRLDGNQVFDAGLRFVGILRGF